MKVSELEVDMGGVAVGVLVVAVTIAVGQLARRVRIRADRRRGIEGSEHPVTRAREAALARAYVDALVLMAAAWALIVSEIASPAVVAVGALVLAIAAGYLRLATHSPRGGSR